MWLGPSDESGSADPSVAEKLYAALVPGRDLYALAPSEGVLGATARALGALATALRRYDDAERHLETAIDIQQRMAARPWLAHAQHDLAAMFVARGEPDRARPYLDDALNAYGELGMETWAARASGPA